MVTVDPADPPDSTPRAEPEATAASADHDASPDREPTAADRHPTAAEEIRAAGHATGDALAGFVGMVAGVHDAISRRVEDNVSPESRPAAHAQREIARGIYKVIAEVHRAAPNAVAEAVSDSVDDESVAPSDTPAGRAALRVVNGLWGDSVATQHPALAIEMSVRVDHHDVRPDGAAIAAAFPDATPSLAVFVHGLAEDDGSWKRDAAGSYGERLLRESGITPVDLRYNSGRHVSDNGRDLSDLMDALVAAWPVPVTDVSLVGHSMGGLVARSAAHQGAQALAQGTGGTWVERLRTVVTLATPHHGAPLEKAVNVADWILTRTPETEPFGRALRARSSGVKDLRYGNLVAEDWQGVDPDEFLTDRRTEVPFLDHVTYCFVATTLTRDPEHPAGVLLGDGLVRRASATGNREAPDDGGATGGRGAPDRGDASEGEPATERLILRESVHLGAVHHLDVLSSPAVYAHLARWLTPRPPPTAQG